ERGRPPRPRPPPRRWAARRTGRAPRRSQARPGPLAVDDRCVRPTRRDAVTDASQFECGRIVAKLPVETVVGYRWQGTDHPVDDPLLCGSGRMMQELHTTVP